MATLVYACNGCVRKCKTEIQGTADEHLERYLICLDITFLTRDPWDRKYQDIIMKIDPSEWSLIPTGWDCIEPSEEQTKNKEMN